MKTSCGVTSDIFDIFIRDPIQGDPLSHGRALWLLNCNCRFRDLKLADFIKYCTRSQACLTPKVPSAGALPFFLRLVRTAEFYDTVMKSTLKFASRDLATTPLSILIRFALPYLQIVP